METITFWSGSSPLTDGTEIQYDVRSEPGAKSVTVSGTLKIDFSEAAREACRTSFCRTAHSLLTPTEN